MKILDGISEIIRLTIKLLTLKVEDKNTFAKKKYINQGTSHKPDKCILAVKKYRYDRGYL